MANDNELQGRIASLLTKGEISQGSVLDALNSILPPDRQVTVESTEEGTEEGITPRSKVFSELDYNDDVVITEQRVTEGLWHGATASLSTFQSSSTQSTQSKDYYVQVQDNQSRDVFDIAWCDLTGNSASIAMYKQMKSILLPEDDDNFTFYSTDTDTVGVIAIDRALVKERIDAGNWELNLGGTTVIDNSGETGSADFSAAGEKYSIYEGTISGGVTGDQEWGRVYLDQGLMVFDNSVLSTSASITSANTFYNQLNSFQARNERYLKDINYFVRLKNRDYNYSNNATFYTASDGSLEIDSFTYDPHTYVTTVGLYNDSNELLAVARLSKPVEKSFDKESLIKVKLSF